VRSLRLFPAALVTLGLAAQAPESLVQKYNSALPGVSKALHELRYKDACDMAGGLVPAQPPAFEAKDIAAIGQSLENARGMLALLKLQANAQAAYGRWETSRDLSAQRVAYAKAVEKDLKAALEAQEGAWKQTMGEGKGYISQNEAKADALEKKLEVLRADIQAYNEKKLKLDAKGLEALKARAAEAPRDEQAFNEMRNRIAGYKDAMNRHTKFVVWASGARRSASEQIKEAEERLAKIEEALKSQAAEIEAFNKVQNARKPRPKTPVTGAKAWVDAVMKDPGNLTKLASPQEQANNLHRLLFLNPDCRPAAQALANLEQGKELFSGMKGSKMNRTNKR